MARRAPLILLLALGVAGFAGPTQAQSDPRATAQAEADRAAGRTRFKCKAGGDIVARFASEDARFIAIVDAGDGPHELGAVDWAGGPAKLTWTDGRRTLTWSPGVQIMWMDGAAHRMCGRGEHRH